MSFRRTRRGSLRPTRLRLAAAAACALAWGVACDGSRHAEPPSLAGAAGGWNVVLLSLDTVRADRLASYGYREREASPTLDGLIAHGTRFERAMAPRAITWPSLASALTGLYPSGHGVIQNGYDFPDAVATLPKLLAAAGYQTGAFLSNMCKANHQGWDVRYCSQSIDGRTTREAIRWAQALDDERPFLLWTHYFAAHPPYSNGRNLARELFDPGYAGELRPKKWVLDRVMTEPLPLDDADRRHLDALYDAALLGTDRTIAHLLTGLEEAGRLENTLIVVLADHGEDLYDHNGYLYHACSVYQSSLHVPLAFVAPGLVEPGTSVPQTVELIDVLPTLVELLGLETAEPMHGESLLPLLERPGLRGPERPAFSEFERSRLRTVLAGGWKLIDNPDEMTPLCFEEAPPDLYPIARVELYDLASDPGETRNLAAERPERVDALRRLIEHRFSGLRQRGEPQELPEELKEELRALGYVAN